MANTDDIIEGVVTASEAFGAYVECDRDEYLIPLHELSWSSLTHASDVVAIGDRIEFVVDRSANPTGSSTPLGSRRRVYPEQNPWRDPSVFAVGTVFDGVVERFLPYGALIQHPRRTLGLLHSDDFPTGKIKVGDFIEVEITDCDLDGKKIRVKPK